MCGVAGALPLCCAAARLMKGQLPITQESLSRPVAGVSCALCAALAEGCCRCFGGSEASGLELFRVTIEASVASRL